MRFVLNISKNKIISLLEGRCYQHIPILEIPPSICTSMAGANVHQKVSDQVYEDLINKTKAELLVQRSDYYINKIRGKKYLIIENDENPEKPKTRFLIDSVQEKTGSIREDIYGQIVNGLYLRIALKPRQKTM